MPWIHYTPPLHRRWPVIHLVQLTGQNGTWSFDGRDLATRPPYCVRDRMGVHRRTVDNFRIALFEKFNIKSKTGLVLFALRYGLMKV